MAALAAVVFLCVQFGLLLHHANQTLTKLDPIVSSLGTVTANINKTLDEINRPCGGHASCGSLADLNKTLGTLRGVLGVVEVAAKHENDQLYALDAQERVLYSDLHTTLVAGQNTLGRSADLLTTANTTVQGLQPVLAETEIAVAQLQTTLGSVNTLVTDPDIPKTLAAVQKTSEQTAATMGNINKTSSDVKDAVHSYLHPSWPHRIFSWSLAVVHALNPL